MITTWTLRTTGEFNANVQVELQKRKRLHYQIYRAQSLSSYYQSLLNHVNPFVPAKCRAKLLLEKINTNKVIIKPAGKGSITVVMTPKDYWNMCYKHLSDTNFIII